MFTSNHNSPIAFNNTSTPVSGAREHAHNLEQHFTAATSKMPIDKENSSEFAG
jgi:hypothetical protein